MKITTYSDHKAKVVEFMTACSPTCINRKEKTKGLYDIDSICFLLPFSQSNLILTYLNFDISFFF